MIVDVHTHVVPPTVIERASAPSGYMGLSVEDGSLIHPGGYRHELEPEYHDVEAKLGHMDSIGVDVSVLSVSPGLFFYGLEPELAGGFAREANDDVARMVGESERLIGVATLPMQDPSLAVAELERCVTELGFRGAQIGTRVGATPLDDPTLEPLMAACDRLDVPLLLHPYHVEPMPQLADYYMANSVGLPLETTIAAVRLIHSGLFDRYPNLRFMLVHAGGFLPFQIGRFDHVYAVRDEARDTIPRPPSSYLDRFWIDTITHCDEALAFVVQAIGPDRVVLGTDLPFDMAERDPVGRLRRVGADPDALGASAYEVLGIPV